MLPPLFWSLPAGLIGQGKVQAWATVYLFGHAPKVHVSRWGLPLITNIFIPDQNMREDYNRAVQRMICPAFHHK
jgi:hypothetical protein